MNADSCVEACTIVLFGITGDLSRRKLIPALYKLLQDKKLCTFAIVGAALEQTSIETIFNRSREFIPDTIDQTTWERLICSARYYQMDFHDQTSYKNLAALIQTTEKQLHLPGNRLFYFATMPNHFATISHHIKECGLVTETTTTPWSRVVYEKPFGYDFASSQKMAESIATIFNEQQIFRIDHYLGKELVGNIAFARFTNRIFEPLWNKEHISKVCIKLHEQGSIGNRGTFYDAYGAIKDMIQSHMLQLLALTSMEMPVRLDADAIRNAKASVLKQVRVTHVVRGQYDGYRNEPFVNPASDTETFAAITLFIDNERWQNVPFYLSTGKCLATKESVIEIYFKPVKCLLTECPSEGNRLIIRITPEDGMYLELNVKAPGTSDRVTPVTMEFCHSCLFGPNTPEAYETLLIDVIRSDQSAFVRIDEVGLSWKIVEQIDACKGPLHTYVKGSKGPSF